MSTKQRLVQAPIWASAAVLMFSGLSMVFGAPTYYEFYLNTFLGSASALTAGLGLKVKGLFDGFIQKRKESKGPEHFKIKLGPNQVLEAHLPDMPKELDLSDVAEGAELTITFSGGYYANIREKTSSSRDVDSDDCDEKPRKKKEERQARLESPKGKQYDADRLLQLLPHMKPTELSALQGLLGKTDNPEALLKTVGELFRRSDSQYDLDNSLLILPRD